MAIRASVTVSIAEETSGTRSTDVARESGRRVNLPGYHVGLCGQQQDIVKGQTELRELRREAGRGVLAGHATMVSVLVVSTGAVYSRPSAGCYPPGGYRASRGA